MRWRRAPNRRAVLCCVTAASGTHPGRTRDASGTQVKYTHMNYHEKLTQILTDFPRLDDIHPFYADLVNVPYIAARMLHSSSYQHSVSIMFYSGYVYASSKQ